MLHLPVQATGLLYIDLIRAQTCAHAHTQTHLSRGYEGFRDLPVPPSRASGDQVGHPTALQQGLHVMAAKIDPDEVPHHSAHDRNLKSVCTLLLSFFQPLVTAGVKRENSYKAS